MDIRRRDRLPAFDFLTRSALWRRLPAPRRGDFRVEALDWTVCQMIHGESLALETARAVASSRAPSSVREAAAARAADEARHLRAFVLYRERVLGRRGEALYADWCPALRRLIAAQPRWELKALALQVVAERAFMGSLLRLRRAWDGRLLRELLGLVIRDERGHCVQLPDADRSSERFVFDACRAMIGDFPTEVFARAGLDAREGLSLYRARAGRGPRAFARLLDSLRPRVGVPGSLRPSYAALELV